MGRYLPIYRSWFANSRRNALGLGREGPQAVNSDGKARKNFVSYLSTVLLHHATIFIKSSLSRSSSAPYVLISYPSKCLVTKHLSGYMTKDWRHSLLQEYRPKVTNEENVNHT